MLGREDLLVVITLNYISSPIRTFIFLKFKIDDYEKLYVYINLSKIVKQKLHFNANLIALIQFLIRNSNMQYKEFLKKTLKQVFLLDFPSFETGPLNSKKRKRIHSSDIHQIPCLQNNRYCIGTTFKTLLTQLMITLCKSFSLPVHKQLCIKL